MARLIRSFWLVWAMAWTVAALPALAGSAGVSNGAIQGVVDGPDGQPLGGVTVVAVRSEDPPVIRNAVTDEMGNFFLKDLYVGSYTLGFSKFGFRTITTQEGSPNQRTALGAQVRAFVEPGSVSTVASVHLAADPAAFGGQVTVMVTDAVTGQGVPNATVVVGPSAAGGTGPGGKYVFQVPPNVDANGNPAPVQASVSADGFESQQSPVSVIPNANASVSFRLQPTMAAVTGRVALGFGISPSELPNVKVLIRDVDPRLASGRVLDSSGNFTVQVPASTASQVRAFTLDFVLDGARVATLDNVVAPRAGARTIATPVSIQPVTSAVRGQVLLSDGTMASGVGLNQAVIVELGQSFPIVNGTFTIPAVPVGRQFTVQVTVINPRTGLPETGQVRVSPVSDGSGSPVFNVAPIVTHPTGGQFRGR